MDEGTEESWGLSPTRGELVARFLYAAAEQCALRGGQKLEITDFARAVALVIPEQCPVHVEINVVDQPPSGYQPGAWPHRALPQPSRAAKRVSDKIWHAPSAMDDLDVLTRTISRIPLQYFDFDSVSTSWEWLPPEGHTPKVGIGKAPEIGRVHARRVMSRGDEGKANP